jgi:hypothetical protein
MGANPSGGFTGRAHGMSRDGFHTYDPAADLWQELARRSSPRGAPAFSAVGGTIHAIGGRIRKFRRRSRHA